MLLILVTKGNTQYNCIVFYAECHMRSVTNKLIMLSVVMLIVIMLSVLMLSVIMMNI